MLWVFHSGCLSDWGSSIHSLLSVFIMKRFWILSNLSLYIEMITFSFHSINVAYYIYVYHLCFLKSPLWSLLFHHSAVFVFQFVLFSCALRCKFGFDLRPFFFFNAWMHSYVYLSEHGFCWIPKFWHIVFSLLFISKYFVISFPISSWTHWLFKSVFIFRYSWISPISSVIAFWFH